MSGAQGVARPEASRPAAAAAGRGALLGAMFLMATSAIGPGFITQTTQFTAELGAAFAFAILASTLVDIGIQLNVWRIVGIAGRRAQELANEVVPGAGWLLTALVVLGGVVFNIGNIAGTGLGTDALFGLDPELGAVLSALIAMGIFLSRRAGMAMDRLVVLLGLVMIALTLYVVVVSDPPLGEALENTVAPEDVDFLVITTLIGGTVGGYITYAGAHRLVDSGVTGPENLRQITRGSVTGIIVTAIMRAVLFLAVLGVVAGGVQLAEEANPPAAAFESAAGELGLRMFGVVFWAAAITSVIGAAYTSVSFLTSSTAGVTSDRRRSLITIAFIALSTVIFVILGETPVDLLIFAGAFNGLILPVGVGLLLWIAWRRSDLLHGYRYPPALLAVGVVAWLLTLYLAYQSIERLGEIFE